MIMTDEQRQFLATHRLCVLGVLAKSGPPLLSPVYYVLDGDDILISTTETRAKTPAVRRNSAVTVCVLGEAPPFPYLTVFGHGRIETEGAAGLMMRVGAVMTGAPVPESARAAVEQRAAEEQRIVLRITPERIAGTPAH
ncbi:MAG TPA: TIGR03618 family F420-dependent PPOX class oxidoreductase [Dehalococcoidia bacterium]|jgi:PPOX class probable F420-dependent enzyme